MGHRYAGLFSPENPPFPPFLKGGEGGFSLSFMLQGNRLVSLAIVVMFAYLTACAAPAAAAQAKTVKPVPAVKSANPAEWDTLVKNAQKEGRVVIYGSGIGDTAGHLKKAFHARYGIDLEFLQGRGAEIIERLFTERRAGLYAVDVGIGGATSFYNQLVPAGIAVSLESMILLDEVRDPSKWRLGRVPYSDDKKILIGLVASAIPCVTINTGAVKDTEISSYNDILAPKWKGRVAMNDPTMTGMGLEWFGFMLLDAYGREKGTEYMRKLALQEPVIVRDERMLVEWGARGKYPVLLGAKPTVVTSFMNSGAPLKFAMVREGGPMTSGALNLFAFDKAPHPNATRLFVNWLLSREAGQIMNDTSGYPSERTDVAKDAFHPALLPGPKDVKGGAMGPGPYELAKNELTKVAAKIFSDTLKQ